MSETAESLRRKISSAGDLHSVVRTMKALAAANIGQYEQSVRALADYYRTIELGLSACFRKNALALPLSTGNRAEVGVINAVVFGSDQGLVGQFNDAVADFAAQALAALPGKVQLWAIGERVHARLTDAGLMPQPPLAVPNSVKAITPLVAQILLKTAMINTRADINALHLFYNSPSAGAVYAPVRQQLLPLDDNWRSQHADLPWPSANLPESIGDPTATLRALLDEYLFVSLFRACAESLASENASRLAAMQRADKNIDELLENLNATFQSLRQSGIDEELFDVVSGFEALVKEP